MYTVISMKWGTKYGPEYVNRLFYMVKRNTTLPFKFVCFTDDAKGLDSNIEVRPLPEMDLPEGPERGWRKLAVFKKDINLEGRVLFLDLDTVIVGNIDDYFTMDGDMILIKHWKPSKEHGIGETGVFRYTVGAHTELYDDFMADKKKFMSAYRHEQAYVGDISNKNGWLSFWPEEWMPSFKYNCMRPFLLGLFLEPILPPKARMVVFHGNPTPEMAAKGEMKGFKKFFRFLKTPKWLLEHWR